MAASILVVLGTGTEVGKTHVAEHLLHALGQRGLRAYGYKPIESGVCDPPESPSDGMRLEAKSCHVKHVPLRYVFEEPISPHLAAHRQGKAIDFTKIISHIRALASELDVLVVELPGGAFSPVSSAWLGIDAARALPEARALLVAVDRLGVLHDVGATTRACALAGVPLAGIVLNAPAIRDKSTGTNQAEIPRVTSVPVLATFVRQTGARPAALDAAAVTLAARLMD